MRPNRKIPRTPRMYRLPRPEQMCSWDFTRQIAETAIRHEEGPRRQESVTLTRILPHRIKNPLFNLSKRRIIVLVTLKGGMRFTAICDLIKRQGLWVEGNVTLRQQNCRNHGMTWLFRVNRHEQLTLTPIP